LHCDSSLSICFKQEKSILNFSILVKIDFKNGNFWIFVIFEIVFLARPNTDNIFRWQTCGGFRNWFSNDFQKVAVLHLEKSRTTPFFRNVEKSPFPTIKPQNIGLNEQIDVRNSYIVFWKKILKTSWKWIVRQKIKVCWICTDDYNFLSKNEQRIRYPQNV
jgi:hypothetical protein